MFSNGNIFKGRFRGGGKLKNSKQCLDYDPHVISDIDITGLYIV